MKELREMKLIPTGEFRKPKEGEYYYCSACREIEKCIHPGMCPRGMIFREVVGEGGL